MEQTATMIDVWKVGPTDDTIGPYVAATWKEACDFMGADWEAAPYGQGYVVRRERMTQEEYDALPEFEGF